MLELIKEIPGPTFFTLYVIVAFFIILYARIYTEIESSSEIQIPEPSQLSPLDIALLYNGVNGAILVSVFNLWRKKKININSKYIFFGFKYIVEISKLSSDMAGLNEVEKIILEKTDSKILYNKFFLAHSTKEIKAASQQRKKNLERLKLLPDDDMKKIIGKLFSY